MKQLKEYTFYADFGLDIENNYMQNHKTNPIKRKWNRKKLENTDEKVNCIAIYVENSKEQLKCNSMYEGASAVYYHTNSDCVTGCIHPDYLRVNCIRISQELARKLHPNLFEYLQD